MLVRGLLIAVALAGCYEPPSSTTCGIQCTDSCPDGLVCTDNVCVPPGGEPCSTPIPEFASVTVGARHTCALDIDGRISCWGDNRLGQLGLGLDVVRADRPRRLGGEGDRWTTVVAGGEHTCALQDGAPWCWGQNQDGQAEGGSGGVLALPTKISFSANPPPPRFDSLAAGSQHTCAIGEGQLWCWGQRDYLGLNGVDPGVAARVGDLADWSELSAGAEHTCAISASQGPMCWGENSHGQLARPESQLFTTPTAVLGLPTGLELRRLIAGSRATCAVMAPPNVDAGELWCWGSSNYRLDTPPTASAIRTPLRIGTAADWTSVSIGDPHICGVRGGMAVCWGNSLNDGLLGDGSWEFRTVGVEAAVVLGPAQQVALGPFAARAAARDDFACLRNGTTIACWGENAYGNLGIGGYTREDAPVAVPAPNGQAWSAVWGGRNHFCATITDGSLWCWGMDDYGQVTAGIARGGEQPCVLGSPCDFPRPMRAPAQIGNPTELATGYDYVCAREGTTVQCWGRRHDGLLGVSNATGAVVTVVPPAGETWARLVGGDRGTCGYTVGAPTTPVCWGRLALTTANTPSQLPAGAGELLDVSFGDDFACGTRGDAARVCWGSNNRGKLGDGTTITNATPFARDAGLIATVIAHRDQACALLTDGTVRCWGDNTYAAVGQPSGTDIVTPSPILSATGMLAGCTQLDMADDHECALCNGTPYCWGRNDHGELGRDTPDDRGQQHLAAPIAGSAGKTFTQLATFEGGGCALADGELWCWGEGEHGELGLGGQARNLPTPLEMP